MTTREPTEMELRVAKAIREIINNGATVEDLARAAIRAMYSFNKDGIIDWSKEDVANEQEILHR